MGGSPGTLAGATGNNTGCRQGLARRCTLAIILLSQRGNLPKNRADPNESKLKMLKDVGLRTAAEHRGLVNEHF